MFLAVDIGNSRIKFAIFDDASIICTAEADTNGVASADCLRIVQGLAASVRAKGRSISQAGISSVVPRATLKILPALTELSAAKPFVITPDIEFGMAIDLDTPHTLGPDRLCAAAAAFEHFGDALAVVDFGTATTISAVDDKGRFIGGSIMPGVYSMLQCLSRDTALLGGATACVSGGATPCDNGGASAAPRGSLTASAPPGKNTESAIASGVVFGTAGAVERIIAEMERTTGLRLKVAATGGAAPCVLPHMNGCDLHDPNLVLKGVRVICRRAHKYRGVAQVAAKKV